MEIDENHKEGKGDMERLFLALSSLGSLYGVSSAFDC